MPRISERTVAEHRARQLRTLLDAAHALVAEQGPEALSLAALARRVGLSRPGLYEYFRSRDDLAAAIVEAELPRRAERIRTAMAGEPELTGRIAAYVRAQLEMMGDERHAAAAALAEHALSPPARARVLAGHTRLLDPLVAALGEAGVPEPQLRAELIQGVVDAAARALRRYDGAPDSVIEAAVDQAIHGVAARG